MTRVVVAANTLFVFLLFIIIQPTSGLSSFSVDSSISSKSMATKAASAAVARNVGKLKIDQTAMLFCDMQERFRSLIYKGETVVQTCRYMTSVAAALDIPIVATQQYTKVFGPTIEDCFDSEKQLSNLHSE